jgi:hypothetical protein
MTEEKKNQAPQAGKKNVFGTMVKVAIGLALLVLGAALILRWLPCLKILVKGTLGLFLVLAGVITLAIAKE